ncbi:hypothetical protein [Epilithonimonas xixisoli]|uniref:Uncharacterized protein n=1 Tax=Epilithonimonas xixisoli TaxID=1476462 RepID=A0A4R8I7Y3_9FLAO|nr:hypothetical protein [Epilithonimonas xixisoli]TDX82702.1 hypothetical protein B0I22_2722 [Epilithonimonas xixisoli]
MKKFLPLVLLLISSIFIFSCKDDNDDIVQVEVDYPTVYDINVNLVQNAPNYFGYNVEFNRALLNQDLVLVYRKNNPSQSSPVWEPLPKTYFFNEGEMDYTFNFTTADVQIDLNSEFDLTLKQDNNFRATYLNGQTFRIVLVPAVFGGKSSVDPRKLSYEEVIRLYNIDDSKIGKL